MRVNCLSPTERLEAIERRLLSLEIGLRELNASIPQLSVFERGIRREFRWFYDALDAVYNAFATELPVANGTIPTLRRVQNMDNLERRIILLTDSLTDIRRKVNNAEYASIQSSIKLDRQLGIITESLNIDRSNRLSLTTIRQLGNDTLYSANQANNKITASSTAILSALALGFGGIGVTLAAIGKSIGLGFTAITAVVNTRFSAMTAVLTGIGNSIAGLYGLINQASLTIQARLGLLEGAVRGIGLSITALENNLRALIISGFNRIESVILNGFNILGDLIRGIDNALSIILSRTLELIGSVNALQVTVVREFNKLIELLNPKFELILERVNQVRALIFTVRAEILNAIQGVYNLLNVPILGSFTLHPFGDSPEIFTFNNVGLGGLRDGLLEIGKALDTVITNEPMAAIPEIAGNAVRGYRPTLVIVYRAFIDGAWSRNGRTYTVFYPDTAKVQSIFDGSLILPSKEQGRFYHRIGLKQGGYLTAYESSPSRALSFLTFLVSLTDPDLIPEDWITKSTKGERFMPLKLEGTFYARSVKYHANGAYHDRAPTNQKTFHYENMY